MTTASLSLISVLSYLGSAFVIAKLSASVAHKHRFHVVLFVLTASALFSHALALHLHVYSDAGLNLGRALHRRVASVTVSLASGQQPWRCRLPSCSNICRDRAMVSQPALTARSTNPNTITHRVINFFL